MGDATRSYSPQAAVLQSEAYNEFRVWVAGTRERVKALLCVVDAKFGTIGRVNRVERIEGKCKEQGGKEGSRARKVGSMQGRAIHWTGASKTTRLDSIHLDSVVAAEAWMRLPKVAWSRPFWGRTKEGGVKSSSAYI